LPHWGYRHLAAAPQVDAAQQQRAPAFILEAWAVNVHIEGLLSCYTHISGHELPVPHIIADWIIIRHPPISGLVDNVNWAAVHSPLDHFRLDIKHTGLVESRVGLKDPGMLEASFHWSTQSSATGRFSKEVYYVTQNSHMEDFACRPAGSTDHEPGK
jgi:hypothetical protein